MQNKELLQTTRDHIKHYMHLSTAEPHVITDDVSCVLVDSTVLLLMKAFYYEVLNKEYSIELKNYLDQACKKR